MLVLLSQFSRPDLLKVGNRARPLGRVSYQPGRRKLRSASSSSLLVPAVSLKSRQRGLHSCWSPCLEHPARRDDISTITDDFLSTSENLAFRTILSWSYSELASLL